MYVRKADLAELVQQPLGVLGVRFGAGDASPELGMAVIAVAARNRGLVLDILLEMLAVDRQIRLLGGQQAPTQIGVFSE